MTLLLDLPLELVWEVIGFLDPISLITLSQTCRCLRYVIQPNRGHFVQRLLALELLPEYGGIVPKFRSRDNELVPSWDSPEWDRNLYACGGCMKLRHHMHFDNHSILRLKWRKPPLDSLEARKLTDWGPPSESRRHVVGFSRRRTMPDEDLEYARRLYHGVANGEVLDRGTLLRIDMEDMKLFDLVAEGAEREVCGRHRHQRRCHDCRLQLGYFSRPTDQHGTADAPIVRSRMRAFPDFLERYFPGLFAPLSPKRTPRNFRVWHVRRTISLALYMAFCVGCKTWQEFASFRKYSGDVNYKPLDQDPDWPVLCCYCSLRTIGRESFTAELACKVTHLVELLMAKFLYQLTFGWKVFGEGVHGEDMYIHELATTKGEDIVPEFSHAPMIPYINTLEGIELVDAIEARGGPLKLRASMKRFRLFVDRVPEVKEHLESWVGVWFEDYDLNEGAYFRLDGIKTRIKTDPSFLVDYLLARQPYRFKAGRIP
ncbi:hypothetical protein QBC47DRAFT_373362 [Echria macrotheca]|uniref:F-box domain-containing protein n=1 Tax=Echria macrotheca TaxID=438768 RepID=A0AAJ0BL52_9PEZI|nr:hypothetical protein QBC47DRAFT_373362 [Echria macrotheca]